MVLDKLVLQGTLTLERQCPRERANSLKICPLGRTSRISILRGLCLNLEGMAQAFICLLSKFRKLDTIGMDSLSIQCLSRLAKIL